MLKNKRKLFLNKNNQIKMKYKFVADKIKRTLTYKLKKNKIDYISEKENEIKIPEGSMIAYISRKGKIIFAPTYAGAHDEIAYKINPLENKRDSTINLIGKGFIGFIDGSSEDEKMAILCYSSSKVTPEQHEKLRQIKEKFGYVYDSEDIDKEELDIENLEKEYDEEEVAVR